MQKSTNELFEIINKHKNLDQLLDTLSPELLNLSLCKYLQQLLQKKHLKKSDVITHSNLDSSYAYQIFNGTKKEPSRDKLLALSIGMSLSPAETQTLLKIAQLPLLYPRFQSDLVIIFALKEHYSIVMLNEILDDLNLPILK